MKKPLVVGNWKTYIEKTEDAKKLASGLRRKSRLFAHATVAVAPSFVHMSAVATALARSPLGLAAQTVGVDAPHTGAVSVQMLKAQKVSMVIVGHSERRRLDAETDAMVSVQLATVQQAGLTALLCVGESERDPGGAHFGVVAGQLEVALRPRGTGGAAKVVVAYEPLWAIGKRSDEAIGAVELQEMAIFIRKQLTDLFGRTAAAGVPILYGGSVEATNAPELLESGIAGFLVGRASTKAESFTELILACKKIARTKTRSVRAA